jgi:hypothetical protein
MDNNRHDNPWETYPRALLRAGGSATVIEANYDSRMSMGEWIKRRKKRFNSRTNDRP